MERATRPTRGGQPADRSAPAPAGPSPDDPTASQDGTAATADPVAAVSASLPPGLLRRLRTKRAGGVIVVLGVLLVAALAALAIANLDLQRVGHTLTSARVGWIVAALALMASSLLLRALSWRETLLAAIPGASIRWLPVARATIIGVMASALVPGRVGEPTRSLMVARRLGQPRKLFSVVMGTVFSQTIINLVALGILAAVTFSTVTIFRGHEGGLIAAVALPVAIVAVVVGGPVLLRRLARARSPRLRHAAQVVTREVTLARRGLRVFARPRHGALAVIAQLAAWALQWLACYSVLLALHLVPQTNLATAAAILLAVNVSAVLPATPSNVGVFQAACLVVLAAYGVGAGPALAYGIMLQAVEVVTAVGLGIPALLREGMTWRDITRVRELEHREAPVGSEGSE